MADLKDIEEKLPNESAAALAGWYWIRHRTYAPEH